MLLGADTGGTFTDVVADDGRIAKVMSTPDDPTSAVASGIDALSDPSGPARPQMLAHGTTVATNALLERKGGVVALVTNEGFADVIEIARQNRPSLYDQWADRAEPLVPRHLRFEVAGRLDATGAELAPIGEVPRLPGDVDAVAVCLLHADLCDAHEQAVASQLSAFDVSCSSTVSPEFREYERTVTTVVNAYLRPVCRTYLAALEPMADDVLVMTSAAGLLPAVEAAELPAALLLSGPAGGVRAGAAAAVAAGFPDAVTFDMGGTSTDVCLVVDGRPEPAAERTIGGLPVRLPSLDVHTIGAGGGSIARLDPGGALVVGPRSAGAVPGPACYGRGGTEPTVTDADVVLGRIPADAAFPGLGRLDRGAAESALRSARVSADGVVAVVDAAMEQAVRVVTVARGVDPRDLALVAFGGAGPLHACAVAAALGMAAVVVPPRAGVLSAVGLLASPRQRTIVRSWPTPDDHGGVAAAADALADEARDLVAASGDVDVEVTFDCRYAGQSHELSVPSVEAFHDAHRRRNGYARPDAPVEVIAIRASASRPAAVDIERLPPAAVGRAPLDGPAVVAEPDCTMWVPAGWHADVGGDGSWILRHSKS